MANAKVASEVAPAIITAEQRAALYDLLLNRLGGIGDIALAAEKHELDAAQRLGREYADDLRLLDGLGWGGECGDESVKLTTPPAVLRRILPRLSEAARGHSVSREPEWIELSELRERNQLIEEACRHVLAGLGE